MMDVFEETASEWRGIGNISRSGLRIRRKYSDFDAEEKFGIKIKAPRENRACICGEVLKGIKTPLGCRLFGKLCTPEHPVGSCMVSSEGACAAYYKYGDASCA
jgi:hydrogenase expression/formation protein HypD